MTFQHASLETGGHATGRWQEFAGGRTSLIVRSTISRLAVTANVGQAVTYQLKEAGRC